MIIFIWNKVEDWFLNKFIVGLKLINLINRVFLYYVLKILGIYNFCFSDLYFKNLFLRNF